MNIWWQKGWNTPGSHQLIRQGRRNNLGCLDILANFFFQFFCFLLLCLEVFFLFDGSQRKISIDQGSCRSSHFSKEALSLSMWSKYPNSIREKNQTPSTIRKILAMCQKIFNFFFFKFFKYPWKNPNNLNYPVLCMKIFLWSKKHKLLDLAMFSKNIENFWDIAKIVWILFG